MKIISGRWKGKELDSPTGDETRPTLQRVKENIFNILYHAPWMIPFEDVRVLDLFAGTGQLGLEALSRGAIRACFIETNVTARGVIRRNIEKIHAEGLTKVYSRSATEMDLMPPQSGGPFNFVFADAPYHTGDGFKAVLKSAEQGWLCPWGIACIEIDKDEAFELPQGWTLHDDRAYGTSRLLFIQWGQSESDSESSESDVQE